MKWAFYLHTHNDANYDKNNINVHVHDHEIEHRKMVPSSLQPAQEICTELALVILCAKSRLRAWHFDHLM